jgi:hypothetical protein
MMVVVAAAVVVMPLRESMAQPMAMDEMTDLVKGQRSSMEMLY